MGKFSLDPEARLPVLLMLLALLVIWLCVDFLFIKKETFVMKEEYDFAPRDKFQIRDKIRNEIKRYETSKDGGDQICALAHILECNYFLIYNRDRRVERYYDLVKIILDPSQRVQLKNRQSYIRQAGRYLMRMRNLPLSFNRYELSPDLSGDPEEGEACVRVRRMMNNEGEGTYLKYHFKRHKNKRFYLYFKDQREYFKTLMILAPREGGDGGSK